MICMFELQVQGKIESHDALDRQLVQNMFEYAREAPENQASYL